MLKPVLILASLVALLPVMVSPAYSTIYIFTDDAGIRNVTNDPRRIPSGTKVQTIGENAYGEDAPAPVTEAPVTETPMSVTETPTPVAETRPEGGVTQGEFAVQLAAELGLGEGLRPQAAVDRLSALRIAPRLGGWELDAPMTPALFDRLSKLTVAAANEGRIPIGLEEARFAFDSAAALARISKHHASIADVPPLPPHIVEEAPVPVYGPAPVVHSGVLFVGAHFSHGGFHRHHHGVRHKHHHVGFHKHRRHHAKARFGFKHKHGFKRHKRRFEQNVIGLRKRHHAKFRAHRFHSRTFSGATRRGHVSGRRLGMIGQRRVGSVRMRSFGGRRMGFGRRVSRTR